MRQKLFFIILALSTFLYAEAYDFKSGNLYYNITSNSEPYTVEVTEGDYSGMTTITIPETVTYNEHAYSVTSIGQEAFVFCSGLTSVTIPNSVTSIGWRAFSGCSSLTSVTFAENSQLTSIGEYAFYCCNGLTSVTIPNSVTSIGDWAFYDCSGLKSVMVNWEEPLSINSNVFGGLTLSDISLYVPKRANEKYEAADVWKKFNIIGVADFEVDGLYYNITSNSEPYTVEVTYQYYWSSDNYSGKTTITIPETVTYGEQTYSVTSIGEDAFYDCIGLTSVTIPNSVTSIGSGAFYCCNGLKSVTIPNLVTSIGDWAFYDCIGLTSVTIPNSVISIGDYAFSECSGLTSVNIPNSVISIGKGAFSNCSGLTSVNIPNSVTSIGDGAFYGCSGLKSVMVNWEEPLSISSNVFGGLTLSGISLYVPNSAKEKYEEASVWKKFNIIGVEIYEVKLSAENGTVTGAGIYLENTTAGIEAIPAEGYHFVRWSDENTGNPREITVTEDLELEAIFEKDVPTAIKAVEAENNDKTIKTIKDGQIVIIRNGVMYDMNGRKK